MASLVRATSQTIFWGTVHSYPCTYLHYFRGYAVLQRLFTTAGGGGAGDNFSTVELVQYSEEVTPEGKEFLRKMTSARSFKLLQEAPWWVISWGPSVTMLVWQFFKLTFSLLLVAKSNSFFRLFSNKCGR